MLNGTLPQYLYRMYIMYYKKSYQINDPSPDPSKCKNPRKLFVYEGFYFLLAVWTRQNLDLDVTNFTMSGEMRLCDFVYQIVYQIKKQLHF